MDDGQKWAVAAARAALLDAGWPDWRVDPERVAVILGNAIGGEKHYQTSLRIAVPRVRARAARDADLRSAAGRRPRGDPRRVGMRTSSPT